MFSRKKKENKESEEFLTKMLYVAKIAPIIYKDNSNQTIKLSDKCFKWSVFVKEAKKYVSDLDIYIDIISKREYVCMHSLSFGELERRIGEYMIGGYIVPYDEFIHKEKTTMEEIEAVIDRVNNSGKYSKNEEQKEDVEISDIVLRTILDTKTKINNSDLDNSEKERLTSSLLSLGEYYINNLLGYQSSNELGKDFETFKFNLSKECMEKLAKIELSSIIHEGVNKDDLTSQYNAFARIMKK